MDYGKLTDNNGKSVNFRNVILILTTNIGGDNLLKKKLGFNTNKENKSNDEEIKFFFKQEFRNRLDSIISFNSLSRKIILKIVNKFLDQLKKKLLEKNILVSFSNEVKNYLVLNGFSDTYGARPLARLIQLKIKEPIADYLLSKSDKSKIYLNIFLSSKNELKFDFSPCLFWLFEKIFRAFFLLVYKY